MKAMNPGSVRWLPSTRVGPYRASRPGSKASATSSRSVRWSAITSRSVSRALARASRRHCRTVSADAWSITPDSAGSPVSNPTDAGGSTRLRSSRGTGGAFLICSRPNRNGGPTSTSTTTGTGDGSSAASDRPATSCPAARMLISGP